MIFNKLGMQKEEMVRSRNIALSGVFNDLLSRTHANCPVENIGVLLLLPAPFQSMEGRK